MYAHISHFFTLNTHNKYLHIFLNFAFFQIIVIFSQSGLSRVKRLISFFLKTIDCLFIKVYLASAF